MRYLGLFVVFIGLVVFVAALIDHYANKFEQSKNHEKWLTAVATPGEERYDLLVIKKIMTIEDLDEFKAMDPLTQRFVRENVDLTGNIGLASLCGQYGQDKVQKGLVPNP